MHILYVGEPTGISVEKDFFKHCSGEIAFGINELKIKLTVLFILFAEGDIIVYPNPAKEILKIQFSGFEITNDINLKLYDINGKLITNKNTKDYSTQIDLSGKPAGTYLLFIVSGKSKKEFTVIKR